MKVCFLVARVAVSGMPEMKWQTAAHSCKSEQPVAIGIVASSLRLWGAELSNRLSEVFLGTRRVSGRHPALHSC